MTLISRRAPRAGDPERLACPLQATALSVKLIQRTGIGRDARILDVDGGLSALMFHLTARGFVHVSGRGLAELQRSPQTSRYDLWRHCMRTPRQGSAKLAYAKALRTSLAPEAWVILGGPVFGDDDPWGALPGLGFRHLETHGEILAGPNVAEQRVRFHIFQRTD